MGWNSWDCYGASVWVSTVIASADDMARHLKPHGWDIITINIQWYEPLARTTQHRRGAVPEMDENGRRLPATNRFPMTAATRSFKPIADYMHAKGLKFGLHLKDLDVLTAKFTQTINSHGAGLYRLRLPK